MDQLGKSCLKTITKEFVLDAYGKKREDAVAAVFAKLKKEAYNSVNGLLIHMEPDDVILLAEDEKNKVQKFLAFFAPKGIQDYYIKLKVIVTIRLM